MNADRTINLKAIVNIIKYNLSILVKNHNNK